MEKSPLLWYNEYNFPFEMRIAPVGEGESELLLSGERGPGRIFLTVVAPPGIQGLTVDYNGTDCTLILGESAIPMSQKAAAGLTGLLDGLLALVPEEGRVGSTAEGAAVLDYGGFSLTLDENGLPALVEAGGRRAEIRVNRDDVTDRSK